MLAFHRYRKHDSEAWDRIHFSRAEDTFRRLIQRFPSQVPAYDSLARLYMERADRSHRPDERVHWYGQAHDLLLSGIRNAVDKSGLYAEEGRLRIVWMSTRTRN